MEQETIEIDELGLMLILPDDWEGKYAPERSDNGEYPEEYADFYTYYRNSGYNLLSYEIKDRQRINDSLYAFHMYYVTEWRGTEAYTFVAWIDNEYRIILNTEYIPP